MSKGISLFDALKEVAVAAPQPLTPYQRICAAEQELSEEIDRINHEVMARFAPDYIIVSNPFNLSSYGHKPGEFHEMNPLVESQDFHSSIMVVKKETFERHKTDFAIHCGNAIVSPAIYYVNKGDAMGWSYNGSADSYTNGYAPLEAEKDKGGLKLGEPDIQKLLAKLTPAIIEALKISRIMPEENIVQFEKLMAGQSNASASLPEASP